jgi:apolipoprotein N-acyltransferase
MLDRLEAYPCETWNYWYGATEQLTPGSVDLIVWSEGASVYPLNLPRKPRAYRNAPCEDISNPAEKLKALAKRLDAEIVVGSSAVEFSKDPDGKTRRSSFNSVYHIDTDGNVARYDKLVPLPFGEYLPLSDVFPFIRDWVEGPGNFRAGTVPVVFEGKVRIATPICYEAILPHVCRRFPDPDLLVNGSLDTWFGDTPATHLHGMLAAIRSTELGIPLLRAGYTGVSMIVEPHGRITSETEPFVEVNRIVTVRMAKVWTLYRALTPYGLQDWFVWLCLVGLIAGRMVAPWLQRRRLR